MKQKLDNSETCPNIMGWILLEKLIVLSLLKNFLAFYGTLNFIIMLTTAHQWPLSSQMNLLHSLHVFLS
jgi:hypothetical protein